MTKQYLKYGILLFAVGLFLFLAAHNPPKNAQAATTCPSCPGNMRSSEDGKSCIPMCNKGDPGCPDVSISCPTFTIDPNKPCATCPEGWHYAGVHSCVSYDSKAVMPCPAAGPANPASVNCVQNLGGTLEIRKDPEGNEYGMCRLPDGGGECEEWALFRGEKCPTCLDYCESRPHTDYAGTWTINGTYPACNCEYSCSTS